MQEMTRIFNDDVFEVYFINLSNPRLKKCFFRSNRKRIFRKSTSEEIESVLVEIVLIFIYKNDLQ